MATRIHSKSRFLVRAVCVAALALLVVILDPIGGIAAAAEAQVEAQSEAAVPTTPLAELDGALLADPVGLLREGRSAAERGEVERAVQVFDALAREHTVVGDYAALLGARARQSANQLVAARAQVEGALSDFPTSPLRSELHALLGDLRQATGDESGARAAWALAYSESEVDALRPALLMKVADSQERAGDLRAARASWLRLWSRHPASDEAERAEQWLTAAEKSPGNPQRSADDYRQRGDRLFAELYNEEALAAYDLALARGLPSALAETTRTRRAHTLFRLRRYPEALAAFSALPAKGDLPIWRARSLARADRVPEAISAFETLARTPGALQADARMFAAGLLEGRKREQEARVHFAWLAEGPDRGELSRNALWRLGWGDYRHRRFADAAARFETLAHQTRDPIARLKADYWRARALTESGEPEAAQKIFDRLAGRFPLTYYGWRARSFASAPAAPEQPGTLARGRSRLTPSALARVRILIDAGLHDYGSSETARLARRAGGLDDRLALARLLATASDFHTAQRLIVDAYELELARGPIAGREEVWRLAWPPAYEELVDTATGAPGSVPRELVYAIMREESGYRPRVISPVGARGLLQIMRETGARLASRAGRPDFDPDDLFDPRVNIELGASYLGELSALFPKRLSASIASYNAGPHVVRDWGPADKRADDEWVEAIPYAETQSYVKRVLRSIAAYRTLYPKAPDTADASQKISHAGD